MTQESEKARWEKAVDQGMALIETIDEDLPEHAWDAASDFFEDVREKVSQVVERIETTKSVSDKQLAALDGWESGVRKWIKE
jgi:archaellum component FlaC